MAYDERWADLADLALIIARELQFRGYADDQAVPLSQSEGMVMRFLQQEPSSAPSRIAAAVGLQRTNLSPILRSLVEKGLVERRTDPADGRGIVVQLTKRGRSNYATVRREWAAAVSAAAGGDTSRLDSTVQLLRAVEAGLTSTRPGMPVSRGGTTV